MDKQQAFHPQPQSVRGTLQPANCFTKLEDSVSQLRLIRNRAEALADTLAGGVPEIPLDGGATKSCGAGRFDQIEMSADEIYGLCSQISSSLSRIEGRL